MIIEKIQIENFRGVEEIAVPYPPVVGGAYKNTTGNGSWDEYEVTAFKENELFELASKNSSYHVRYTYKPTEGGTELEYFEWMDEGELEGAFEQPVMMKLKDVTEKLWPASYISVH